MIRNGQPVYFYQKTGEYQGTILSGIVTSIVKDFPENKTFYNVKVTKTYFDWDAWYIDKNFKLEKNQIYTSKKQIEKEYKEEIVYNTLYKELANIERILADIFNEVKEKPVTVDNWKTLTINGTTAFSKLVVKAEDITVGETNLKEEIDKLKKEVDSIKKKIKTKTKKPVIKEENTESNQNIKGVK